MLNTPAQSLGSLVPIFGGGDESSGGGGGSRDHQAPKYIVGNATSGDTIDVCDFLDEGNGAGFAAALAAAAAVDGDVYVRPGSMNLAAAGSPVLPLVIPNYCTVWSAGSNLVSLIYQGAPQRIFTIQNAGMLRGFDIQCFNIADAPGAQEVIYATRSTSDTMSPMLEDVSLVWEVTATAYSYGVNVNCTNPEGTELAIASCKLQARNDGSAAATAILVSAATSDSVNASLENVTVISLTGTLDHVASGGPVRWSMQGCNFLNKRGSSRIVTVQNSDKVTIDDCVFADASDAAPSTVPFVDLTGVLAQISECSFFGVGTQVAVSLAESGTAPTSLAMSGCDLTTIPTAVFQTGTSINDVVFTGNTVIVSLGSAPLTDRAVVDVSTATSVVVTGNSMKAVYCGVHTGNANTTVSGNDIDQVEDGPLAYALSIGSGRHSIVGNTIHHNGDQDAVLVNNAARATIANNTITSDSPDAGAYGIRVANSATVVVNGNTVWVPVGGGAARGGITLPNLTYNSIVSNNIVMGSFGTDFGFLIGGTPNTVLGNIVSTDTPAQDYSIVPGCEVAHNTTVAL